MTSLEQNKLSLIDLIKWYRDEYHKKDFCHTEMISEIDKINDEHDLEIYWQVVDNWLDD